MRKCNRCGIQLAWNDGQISDIVQRPKTITELLCYPCYHEKRRLIDLVKFHNYRAKKLGLVNTLTVAQWLSVQTDFNGKCAYCQKEKGDILEHFVPLSYGGGTVRGNIVPACDTCNRKKIGQHPAFTKNIPQEDIERVRQYLAGFCES